MAIPIMLYDENHERVGETYHRRAKQLVRSGRAVWLDEGYSLQMTSCQAAEMPISPPTKEELSIMENIYVNNGVTPEVLEVPHPAAHNELRMYLARQNVARKKNLIRNIIAYVLAWVVCFGMMHTVGARQVHSTNIAFSEPFVEVMEQPFNIRQNVFEFHPNIFESALEAHNIENAFGHIADALERFEIRGWINPIYFADDVLRVVSENSMARSRAYTAHTISVPRYVTAHTRNYNSWFFVVGIMFAWGVWILARGIQVSRQHYQSRPRKLTKPDPVAMEYQRLSSMTDYS